MKRLPDIGELVRFKERDEEGIPLKLVGQTGEIWDLLGQRTVVVRFQDGRKIPADIGSFDPANNGCSAI